MATTSSSVQQLLRGITLTNNPGSVQQLQREILFGNVGGPIYSFQRALVFGAVGGPIFQFEKAPGLQLIRGPQLEPQDLTIDRLADNSASLANTTGDIDLTTTGTTAIYTSPSGVITYVLGVALQVSYGNAVTVPPEVSVGINPSTDNVFATEELIGVEAAGDAYIFWANLNTGVAVGPTEQLDLNVATAATATSLVVSAHVIALQV